MLVQREDVLKISSIVNGANPYDVRLTEGNAPLEASRECFLCVRVCLVRSSYFCTKSDFHSGKQTGFVSMATPLGVHRGRTHQKNRPQYD